MRIRYRPDRTEHRAWLGRRRARPGADGLALFVRYGAAIAVTRLEAERDCELLAATRQELAELPAAGYHIPLAGDFQGADAPSSGPVLMSAASSAFPSSTARGAADGLGRHQEGELSPG